MRWPWHHRGEQRAYSDTVVNALLAAAAGGVNADARATGAVQAASGFWSRTLAAATVAPATGTGALITPALLYDVGRALILDGEYLAQFQITDVGPMLVRPSDHDVHGGADPASWKYRLQFAGPSRETTGAGTYSDVIHIRINTHPSAPHRGVSPVAAASSTGGILGGVEKQLSKEAGHVSGYVLPSASSEGMDDDTFAQLKADLAQLSGGTRIVPSLGPRVGDPQGRSADGDWQSRRIGISPPAAVVDLRSSAGLSILAACGIPIPLVAEKSDSASLREAMRQLVYMTIMPVARIIERELQRVLELELRLDFAALNAADIQGRARSFKSLVDGGLPIPEARSLTGMGT